MRPTSTIPILQAIALLFSTPAAAEPDPSATAPPEALAEQVLPPAELPQHLIPLGESPAAPSLAGDQARKAHASADSAAAAQPEEQAASEIEEQSAELEAVRQAEERQKIQEAPRAGDSASQSASGLGLESPLRGRLEDALGRDIQPPTPGDEGRIPLLPELDHGLTRLQSEYDIPVEVNEEVVAYIRFFQTEPVRSHFVKWLGRSHKYMERYRAILHDEGLPEDTVFLAMIESGFGNFAYSRARAVGPWQFIAATGRLMGLKQDFWVDERRDPEKSARAAARFLRSLHEATGDWRLAWASYNAGLGRIQRAKALGYDDFWAMAATSGRHVLRAETKGYVPKLMAAAIITKHPEAFGFRPEEIEPESWTDYAEVLVPHATLLSQIARAAGVPERALVELNPELRRACTPPRAYQLKIPKAAQETFAENWPALSKVVRTTFAGHVVRRGDTLSRIAAAYGVPVQGIREMNGIPEGRRLRVGQEIVVPRPIGVAAAAARAEPLALAQAARRPEAARPARPAPVVAAEATNAEPKAEVRAEPKSRTTLLVRAGDTLWSISQKLGVTVADLCRWNRIKNPRRHKLMVGAYIVVFAERG